MMNAAIVRNCKHRGATLFGVTLIAIFTGCGSDNVAPGVGPEPRVAKTRSAPIASVVVSSVSPDSATQDTTLDVTINGSGFVAGSTATWQFAGASDPLQVRTNSTRYVNSRQLVANVTISSTATIGKWDVSVMAGSKGGIGTEAFAIKTKVLGATDTNARVNYVLANQVDVSGPGSLPDIRSAGLVGDGRLRAGSSSNGGDSEYQSRFCAATGSITNALQTNGSTGPGDLFFNPGDGTTPCGDRRFFLANLDGVMTRLAPDSRVYAIWAMAVDQNLIKPFSLDTRTYRGDLGLANCVILEFDPVYGGDAISVTRIADAAGVRRWLLKSRGSHLAACANPTKRGLVASGKKYYLPFAITLTEVPYPPPSYP
ncbi:MAG TPA: hypothetical protein VM099_16745 [Gemmatimonadaceae bacterium]|nr:hypothetical protein [Gemmatimonadaceae bacterium]